MSTFLIARLKFYDEHTEDLIALLELDDEKLEQIKAAKNHLENIELDYVRALKTDFGFLYPDIILSHLPDDLEPFQEIIYEEEYIKVSEQMFRHMEGLKEYESGLRIEGNLACIDKRDFHIESYTKHGGQECEMGSFTFDIDKEPIEKDIQMLEAEVLGKKMIWNDPEPKDELDYTIVELGEIKYGSREVEIIYNKDYEATVPFEEIEILD